MTNKEFRKQMDDRTLDLIAQIQRHEETIVNIVKSAYERGYADGKDCKALNNGSIHQYIAGYKSALDTLSNKIAGHSDYHGDSILAAIQLLKEGREPGEIYIPVYGEILLRGDKDDR
jgi:hypothetical protein